MQRRQLIAGSMDAIGASVIWGFAFIALRWTLQGIGPFWLTTGRFLAAFLVFVPVFFVSPTLRSSISRKHLSLSILPGLTLGMTLVLQSSGLLFTTVSKAGFITVLYVVLVPVFERLFLHESIPGSHWWFVLLSLVGTGLLGGFDPTSWNKGDLLTLGCAVMAALHFIAVQAVRDPMITPFAMNLWQDFWAGIVTLPIALILESFPCGSWSTKTIGSLGYLVAGSTIIAFFLQVRALRHLSSSVVSLLCLLESPFAALFARLILGERLTLIQLAGAALIMAAAAGSLIPWWRKAEIAFPSTTVVK